MKKSAASKRGVQDAGQQPAQQPDKVGWIRKFCGRGIFRELWRNRFMVLRGEHLYISEKEVKDDGKAQEMFHLADYERSEELRKAKSRSKKNHSRFILLRCKRPGTTVPNLLFLAVSPEEKESWISALNGAITRARNRAFHEVMMEEDGVLAHPTRDRARIPYGRRLPTRGHLLAVASTSSHGMLTLDLVAEEDAASQDYDRDRDDSWEKDLQVELQRAGQTEVIRARQRADTDVSKLRLASREPRLKTGSLPRGSERSWGRSPHLDAAKVHKKHQVQVLQAQSRTPQPGKRFPTQARSRCASMDEVLSSRPAMIRSELRSALRRGPTEEAAAAGGAAPAPPVGQLQSLIAQRMQRAQELLEEMRLQELQKARAERERAGGSPYLQGVDSPRLHHLRGSDSAHSRSSGSPRSRSSDSPRLRGRDSPRLRGRESPRSKAKRNRSKGTDSPRSRGSSSPAARTKDSPQAKDLLQLTAAEAGPSPREQGPSRCSGPGPDPEDVCPAQNPPEANSQASDATQVKSGSDLLRKAESCGSDPGSPGPEQKVCPSPSGSVESSQSRTPDEPRVSPPSPVLLAEGDPDVASQRAEAERLLEEAVSSWKEAQEVLQEVKELQSQTLRRQRRRTYEKMMATPAATDESDTVASPTSPEEDEEGESETA